MNFDLTISADDIGYLNPEFYLLASSLIDNLPEDTVLHVTTNRSDDDKALQFLKDSVNTKVYKEPKFWHLKSRCSYLLHSFKIKTDKEWIIKLDVDVLALKHLTEFNKILDKKYDIIISPENRHIFKDREALETRLWRQMYTKMAVKSPDWKMKFIENGKEGLPLFNTGIIALKTEYLDVINKYWIPWTMVCEDYIEFNVHPNEQAMTAIIQDQGFRWKQLPVEFGWNPIGHLRRGDFPSIELRENAIIPDDVILLHWHKPQCLRHLSLYNPMIRELIDRNKEYIPEEWWNLPMETFMERNYNACGFYI